jgi:hypothetical protein
MQKMQKDLGGAGPPPQGTSQAETRHRLLTKICFVSNEFWDPGVRCVIL